MYPVPDSDLNGTALPSTRTSIVRGAGNAMSTVPIPRILTLACASSPSVSTTSALTISVKQGCAPRAA